MQEAAAAGAIARVAVDRSDDPMLAEADRVGIALLPGAATGIRALPPTGAGSRSRVSLGSCPVGRLSGADERALSALGDLLDAVEVKREGMVATSFDVALGKFNRSHVPENAFEHLVDLATALEAILSGGESDNEALTLRLKTRAAALLSSSRDPAKAIFDDVGVLYGLRSRLVHGGQIKEAELRKIVRRVSTVPAEAAFGVALAHAVDRIRDLVRRSILVRICLAYEPDPPWPFSNTAPVDALLVEPDTRRLWQERVRERMEAIGGGSAVDRPRVAADFLSPEDR